MPIVPEDVKLMASQRLTDYPDGGGRMSGVEIVDGNINNLFPDISRLDRTYGRVSLRKAFVSVQSLDTDTYSGAHVILSEPAADPKVNVCLFSTSSPHDDRTAARDRIESYVVKGPRFRGWLWGDQPEGARSIIIFAVQGTPTPEIGSVLYLVNDQGLPTEQSQYVRITKVEVARSEFASTSEGADIGATAMAFSRDVFTIEIGDPLRYTFKGREIDKNDTAPTTVYTTTVYDAARYYGVMRPTADIAEGDIAINVDSIFTHLVPSAQGEAPLTDLSVAEAGPVMEAGPSHTISVPSFTVKEGARFNFGRGIGRGSLKFVCGGRTYTETGDGILYEGTAQRGQVDYGEGTLTFRGVDTHSGSTTATAVVGATAARVADTRIIPVVQSNQGYNYTVILLPQPAPGTVMVDYMSQGRWYRLRDNGSGTLVPDVAGTGTGSVNYTTGSCTLTCAALPDVGSGVLFAWGAPLEVRSLIGETSITAAEVVHQLESAPVKPGSLVITWPSGETTAQATDNGQGVITGDATGGINYATGQLRFTPTQIPAAGAAYSMSWQRYPVVIGQSEGVFAGGNLSITLPEQPVAPGSVNVDVAVEFSGGITHAYTLVDDGNGQVRAAAGGGAVSGDPGLGLLNGPPQGMPAISARAPALQGSIDYVLGKIVLSLAGVRGERIEVIHERTVTPGLMVGSFETLARSGPKVVYVPRESTSFIDVTGASSGAARYTLQGAGHEAQTAEVEAQPFEIELCRAIYGTALVPGSISFTWGGKRYIDRLGKIYRNPDPVTGLGVEVGTIDYTTGKVRLDAYDGGSNALTVHSLLARSGRQFLYDCTFRTPGAPVRPGSLSLVAVTPTGEQISATSAFDGAISGDLVSGVIDYETGIVALNFRELVSVTPEVEGESWYNPEMVEDGKAWKPVPVYADSIAYTCVVYSYIPLDADLIGIDPVRLPSDGRVPIVREGDVVVVHNTQTDTLPAGLSAGQVLTLSRPNIDYVELYDADGAYVPSTLYTWARDTQKLTMATPLDLTGYTQPLAALHRIEDMRLVHGVQINGQVIVSPGLDHAYPQEGTFVSSALLFGDLQARVSGLFDQKTWTNVWSDAVIGDVAVASYNEVNYPVLTTNAGAVQGRWALVFTDADHFNVIEEKLGIIGEGYTSQDCQPTNPATGEPYFFLDYRGWGAGWAYGNVLRFNTSGANPPLWVARTTLQGPVTEPVDKFTIQIRGDVQ